MQSWTVDTSQRVTYEVREAPGVLDPNNQALAGAAGFHTGGRYLVVVDAEVDRLYGARIRRYLANYRVRAHVLTLAVDEDGKNVEALLEVVRAAAGAGIRRRSEPIIAIGGGVLTDIVGLAASLYRRGTPFVRVPTTLIGLVDAGVGAKTAVNFEQGKNRIGSYHPAAVSLLDPSFLATLPARHVSNGLAEIVKIALIKDHRLFVLLERTAETILHDRDFTGRAQQQVLRRAVSGMLEELEPNLWEHDLQRLVDFGHTFSPPLEMRSGILHGEAVAVDMAFSSVLAHRRGLLDGQSLHRALALLDRCGLPRRHPLCEDDLLWEALQDATRHRDGLQRCPLPNGIGKAVFVNDLTAQEIVDACRALSSVTVSSRL